MFVRTSGHTLTASNPECECVHALPVQRTEAPRFPSLTTTVPREFVHRAAVAEVLLTDWARIDDTRFTVLAQWPRSHSFFTPLQGDHHDPLIALETIRQIGSLLGHAEFDVPFDRRFLLQEIDMAVTDYRQLLVGDAPAGLEIEVNCTDVKRRGGKLTGMAYRTVIHRNGVPAATGGLSYTCVPDEVYQRVRGGRGQASDIRPIPPTAPVPAHTVGRTSPLDVVLSPGDEPDCWRLRVDTRHPVLFDHPVDHVPGMLLIEAARQASAAIHGNPMPLGVTCEFQRYVELDAPCTIKATRLDDGTHIVTAHQDDQVAFTATVTVSPGAA